MTVMLTNPISRTAARPARPLPSKCAAHRRYTAGCPDCQHAARIYEAARAKAAILGIHQPQLVPAIGAARRLQALAAIGHDAVRLAGPLHTTPKQVRDWRTPTCPTITRRRHNNIRDLAEHLAETRGMSRMARTVAHHNGWVPLAAWDDIDDPDALPRLRDDRHQRDGRPLIERVLAGRAHIELLTEAEQARLCLRWVEDRQRQGLRHGPKSFGRQFDLSESRARRIIAAAQQQTPTTAADSRTNRKVA